MHVLEVRNAELVQSLTEQAAKLGITDAAIVTLIGAVDTFVMSTMPKGDPHNDILTSYDDPAEMTATGEVIGGVVHIHAVMAVEGDRAVAGHLLSAEVGSHFARAYMVAVN